jgi:DNA-directed RNA polymerase specialized sigma24 family protein
MRSLVVRETALNMYFMDGHSYQYVAKLLDVPLDTVKSWVAFLPFFIDF